MKNARLALLIAVCLLLSLPAAYADDPPAYGMFRHPFRGFTGQDDVTDEDLAALDAWAAAYVDTDPLALFVEGYGQKSVWRGDKNHHAITGPFYIIRNTETGAILNTAGGEDPRDLYARGMLALEPLDKDTTVWNDTVIAFFNASRFATFAREDAPAIACLFYYSGYNNIGEYRGVVGDVETMRGTYQYINLRTGEMDSRDSYGISSSPNTISGVRTDAYGHQITSGPKPWDSLFEEKMYLGDTWRIRDGELLAYHGMDVDVVVPEGVLTIGRDAFRSHSDIRSVTLPHGVTRIAHEAFMYCDGLEEVILPETLESIGDDAFKKCTSLATLVLPESLRSMGWSALVDTALTTLRIPSQLGGNTRLSLTNVETLVIASDTYEVDRGQSSLRTIIFEEGVVAPYLGFMDRYFTGSHVDIWLPASATAFEARPFERVGKECPELFTIHAPEGSEAIKLAKKYGVEWMAME